MHLPIERHCKCSKKASKMHPCCAFESHDLWKTHHKHGKIAGSFGSHYQPLFLFSTTLKTLSSDDNFQRPKVWCIPIVLPILYDISHLETAKYQRINNSSVLHTNPVLHDISSLKSHRSSKLSAVRFKSKNLNLCLKHLFPIITAPPVPPPHWRNPQRMQNHHQPGSLQPAPCTRVLRELPVCHPSGPSYGLHHAPWDLNFREIVEEHSQKEQ